MNAGRGLLGRVVVIAAVLLVLAGASFAGVSLVGRDTARKLGSSPSVSSGDAGVGSPVRSVDPGSTLGALVPPARVSLAKPTTGVARRARGASRVRFGGLSSRAAIRVGRRHFHSELATPVFSGLRPSAGTRLVRPLSRHAALVKRGGQTLIEVSTAAQAVRHVARVAGSSTRHSTRSLSPVNLSLAETDGGFEPATPAAAVTIGDSIDDGVSLPGGVSIAMKADEDVPAQLSDDRVWYPNAATDTDLIVTPAFVGVQQDLLLRSASSPEQFEFSVEVPAGGRLRWAVSDVPVPDGLPRAIEVLGPDDRPLAYVYPPTAYDADGQLIEATEDFDGMTIRLAVEHRGEDIRYPAFVDPTVATVGNTGVGYPGWSAGTNGTYYTDYNPAVAPGLAVTTLYNANYQNGQYGQHMFTAPAGTRIASTNFFNWSHHAWASALELGFAQPNWIERAGFRNHGDNSQSANPYRFYGTASGEIGTGCINKPSAPVGTFDCADPPGGAQTTAVDGNQALFRLSVFNPYNNNIINSGNNYAQIAMSNVQVDMADIHPPYIASADAPEDGSVGTWTDDGGPAGGTKTYRVNFNARDVGVGLRGYDLTGDATNITNNGHSDYIDQGICTGDPYGRRCPNDEPGTFDYNLAEGSHTLNLSLYDVTGNRSETRTWTQRIDRSAPNVTLSGVLYNARNRPDDHRNEGIYAALNPLHVDISDPHSGIADTEVFVNGMSQRSNGGYSNGSTLDWTLRADDYPDGQLTIKVVSRDQLAATEPSLAPTHTRTLTFDVTVDRRGDIYAADLDDADLVSGGTVEQQEWGKLGTRTGRAANDDFIATRRTIPCNDSDPGGPSCGETRLATRSRASSDNAQDYEVTRGSSTTDPALPDVANILSAVPDNQAPNATGSIVSAAAPWQHLPPAHGLQYARYDVSGSDSNGESMTGQVWVDSATRMPIRSVVQSARRQLRHLLRLLGRASDGRRSAGRLLCHATTRDRRSRNG